MEQGSLVSFGEVACLLPVVPLLPRSLVALLSQELALCLLFLLGLPFSLLLLFGSLLGLVLSPFLLVFGLLFSLFVVGELLHVLVELIGGVAQDLLVR